MTPTDHSRPLPGVIELAEERVLLGKRLVDRGGVRVASRTELVEEAVQATLSEQVVEVERVPVGRFVERAEAPRTEVTAEGEVTVLPVYEERIVTEYGKTDGVPTPKKVLINHDGNKFMELEVLETKQLEKLDDSEFAKP